ncbi:MAG: hypothetical protein MZW92_03105 [Comamonadaceae bacterium]|nr:hypothetical protein [Comamonadaceae bacterium]
MQQSWGPTLTEAHRPLLCRLIMAVLAALPFLLVRVFAPGPVSGSSGVKASAPALEMNLPDAGAAWAAETLAGPDPRSRRSPRSSRADIAGGYIADGDPRLERWLALARDHGAGHVRPLRRDAARRGPSPQPPAEGGRDPAPHLGRLRGRAGPAGRRARASTRPTWPSPRPARRTSCTGPPRPPPSRAGPWAST